MNKILIEVEQRPELNQEHYSDDWFDHSDRMAGLKHSSIKGGVNTTVSQMVVFFINTLSTVVLARILVPADFGLVSMVAAFAGFVGIFKDLGFSMAIIQRDVVTHDQISVLFWYNVILCLFISFVFVLSGNFICRFYHEPKLFLIIVAYSASIFLSSLSVQHNAILSRRMEFNKIAISNIISTFLSVIVSVILAYAGFGYWSLVFLTISQSFFFTVLLWIYCPWKPRVLFWQRGIYSFIKFGAGISGFNIINYFSRNLDNVIIGKYLGSTILGFYSKAFQLMMMPLTKLRDPLVTVGTPALSSLNGNMERFKRYYNRLVFIICFFSFPMTIFLSIFAKDLILIVLGPQWIQSVVIFQLLSIPALIEPLTGTTGMIFIATGRSYQFFKIGLVSSGLIILSFILGIHWGIYGLIVSYTAARYILFFPILIYCFRGTPIKLNSFLKELLIQIFHAGAIAILLLILRIILAGFLSSFFTVAISFIIAVPAYYFSWLIYANGRRRIEDINSLVKMVFDKARLIFGLG